MMIGGLHHIPDRQAAISNACQALMVGGILILHEPLKTGRSHRLVPLIKNLDALTDPKRLWRAMLRRLGRPSRSPTVDTDRHTTSPPLNGRLHLQPSSPPCCLLTCMLLTFGPKASCQITNSVLICKGDT